MKSWELFEINCTNYLNENFNYPNVSFIRGGGNDSNSTDISVYHESKKIIGIECKLSLSKAQSSQFVVKVDKQKHNFYIPPKVKSLYCDTYDIISHMNNNFEYYSRENSEGEIYNKLICEKDIMINYVKKNISRKSSLIIASRYKEDFSHKRPLFVGEIAKLHQFFEIEGVYRGKYSGSRHASKKKIKNFPFETNIFGKRYYVYDPHNNLEDYPNKDRSFFLPKEGEKIKGYREVRIPSNTRNNNVIFKLKLNSDVHSDLSVLRLMVDQKIVS